MVALDIMLNESSTDNPFVMTSLHDLTGSFVVEFLLFGRLFSFPFGILQSAVELMFELFIVEQ